MKNALMIGTALLIAGCSPERPQGHWEGKGRAVETSMKDKYRTLTKRVTTEFWFTLQPDGTAAGEIELTYDVQLVVDLPIVENGVASFSPTVGGALADLDPSRKFPLAGVYDGMNLVLEIAMPEDERPKLDFVIHASPGVSAKVQTIEVGSASAGGFDTHLPMKPFSPFGNKGAPLGKSFGRYAARYEEKGDRYAITWSARKVEDLNDRRTPSGPEIDRAIQSIRAALQR